MTTNTRSWLNDLYEWWVDGSEWPFNQQLVEIDRIGKHLPPQSPNNQTNNFATYIKVAQLWGLICITLLVHLITLTGFKLKHSSYMHRYMHHCTLQSPIVHYLLSMRTSLVYLASFQPLRFGRNCQEKLGWVFELFKCGFKTKELRYALFTL